VTDPRSWLRVVAVALVSTGAALGAGSLFAGARDVPLLLGAVAVPAAVTAGLRPVRRGRAVWLPGLGGTAALAAYVALAIAPGSDVADGPDRLLTGALPLDASGPELAAVAGLVGLSAVAGAALAAGSRARAAAALPGVLAYAVVQWVAASVPAPTPLAPVVAVLGCALLLAALTVRPGSTVGVGATGRGPRLAGAGAAAPPRARSVPALIAATVAVAAVTATVALVAPVLPGRDLRADPADARDLVVQPVSVRRDVSPLVRFPALQTGADQVLYVVRPVAGSRAATRGLALRWATLDRFDGRIWSTRARYQRAGRSLPPGPALGVPSTRVAVDVEVAGGAGTAWLPSFGRPVSVSSSGLGVDPVTGDLVVPDDAAPVSSYRVTGAVPDYDPAALRAAVAEPAGPAGYRVTPAIVHAAQAASSGATTTFGRLAALEDSLRRDPRFTLATGTDAPAGHGVFQVGRLLRTRRGTAEEYASAFAVLARVLGYDARVVVGFRPPYDDSAGGYVVRSRTVHAWPEVNFRGLGWVPFEPTPRRTSPGGDEPDAGGGRSAVDRAIRQEAAARAAAPVNRVPPAPETRRGGPAWWLRAVLLLGVALGLVVVGTGLVPVVKVVRRQRRRSRRDPGERALAAWDEVADRLTDHGLAATRPTSRPELAAATVARAPVLAASVPDLARLADAVGFSGRPTEARVGEAAWTYADQARAALARRAGLLGRLRAWCSARSLLGRASRLRRTG
jgi:transglutaminase-like putative cysteine protease